MRFRIVEEKLEGKKPIYIPQYSYDNFFAKLLNTWYCIGHDQFFVKSKYFTIDRSEFKGTDYKYSHWYKPYFLEYDLALKCVEDYKKYLKSYLRKEYIKITEL